MIDFVLFNGGKVLKKMGFPASICHKFNDVRHKYVMNKLEPVFAETMEKMQNSRSSDLQVAETSKIFVVWLQGEENAPELVKKCIYSLRKHSSGHEVVLITENNLKEYTNISQNIFEKYKSRKISPTHFSDVLRFNLLKNRKR